MEQYVTIGEKYGPAMHIHTQEEADKYFEECVQHSMLFGNSREKAIEIEKQNIGYYTGYYDDETAERAKRLFKCKHPIFDEMIVFMNCEDAFKKGVELGERHKNMGDK